ncbi:hypothetical protein BpHYR1_025126 [Brachionus plicatilis]|uniref:Uncharacterized protein n=1 Tax=Brachionus plicatilis TaxID=10195 RepID=A0A3M7RRS5_BRAPC|nr:hypothetical protein BpHYR1_025126 [Brachionus plicatilis]
MIFKHGKLSYIYFNHTSSEQALISKIILAISSAQSNSDILKKLRMFRERLFTTIIYFIKNKTKCCFKV